MSPQLFGYVMFFSAITPIIPIGVIFYRRKYISPYILRNMLIMLFFNLLIEGLSYVSLSLWQNNDLVIDLLSLVWGVLLIELYRFELSGKKLKKRFRILVVLYVVYNIMNAISPWLFGFSLIDTYLILSLLVIGLSIYYLYNIFIKMEIENITQHYFFWINSAMLIFFGSTIFITLFEGIVAAFGNQVYLDIWPVQLFATVLFNVILAKGLWVTKQT